MDPFGFMLPGTFLRVSGRRNGECAGKGQKVGRSAVREKHSILAGKKTVDIRKSIYITVQSAPFEGDPQMALFLCSQQSGVQPENKTF